MKVLITSDTHGRYDRLRAISLKHPDKDYHLDAGDLVLSQAELESLHITGVKGNGDLYLDLPLQQIVIVDHKKFLLVHGHIQEVKYGLDKLVKLAEYIQVDYVIYGHTHERKLLEYHGITYINPGAVSGITPSYAIYQDGKITFHQGV